MEIDLDTFKAKRPLRDLTFWLALVMSVPLVLPLMLDAWHSKVFPTGGQMSAALMPVTAWLVMHGIIRREGVVQAGNVTSTNVAVTSPDRFVQTEPLDYDDPDTMPEPAPGGCALVAVPKDES